MFLGSMMAFLFCGLTMNAVGRAAGHMVDEVRRQFRDIKGILTGEAEPDYERCVEISTKGAQREMVIPSLIAIIAQMCIRDSNQDGNTIRSLPDADHGCQRSCLARK